MSIAMENRSHYVNGRWCSGGGAMFESLDPTSGQVVWRGTAAGVAEVDAAFAAAREAAPGWASLDFADRARHLEQFARVLETHRDELATTISREIGKPRWESREEVGAMIAKSGISVAAARERRNETSSVTAGVRAVTRYKPHGVVAVLGPFNLPGHLPNGHIVPALLAGNTVVYKPSELAPDVAQHTVELWEQSGLPAGVLNLVQGGRETGVLVARHRELDGLFFTGSFAAGQALNQLLALAPHKILALEMGGNNPLIAWPPVDPHAAAMAIVQSAYVTAGQRCSCARRLIVPAGKAGEDIVASLLDLLPRVRVGAPGDGLEAFMGPVIHPGAAGRLLAAQEELLARGGVGLCPMMRDSGSAMLRPGLIDVTAVTDREDTEHFGPLLQLIRVNDFDAAIAEANRTAYGLVAGLLCDDRSLYERFLIRIRAGVVNWNRPTTGASSRLPFGGVGRSGNHRPAGYWSCDYCSYPVASLEVETLTAPPQLPQGIQAEKGPEA